MNQKKPKLEKIFAINAGDIPPHLYDDCLAIDDEFPLHYDYGIVRINDDGNPFAEWLKALGFVFDKSWAGSPHAFGWLGVWGT